MLHNQMIFIWYLCNIVNLIAGYYHKASSKECGSDNFQIRGRPPEEIVEQAQGRTRVGILLVAKPKKRSLRLHQWWITKSEIRTKGVTSEWLKVT